MPDTKKGSQISVLAMVNVKVLYVGYMKELLHISQEKVGLSIGSSVNELLNLLSEKYGEAFSSLVLRGNSTVDAWACILVNDQDIETGDGLNTKLNEGAEVCIMALYELPVGG